MFRYYGQLGYRFQPLLSFGNLNALVSAHERRRRGGSSATCARERRPPRPGEVTHSVTVRVDDVHAHCERARAHGARIVMEPVDFEYGERQYTAEDPAGHQWTFSETLDDVDPGEWGGILVRPGA